MRGVEKNILMVGEMKNRENFLRKENSMHVEYPNRIKMANIPTPLRKAERISRETGVDIFIKRDDMTGIELSGNKVRKLEFLLAEARDEGADAIVTCGGIQSNHCRATAAACVRLGFKCHLVLRGEKPEAPYDGNLLLDHLLGAQISYQSPDEFRKNLSAGFPGVMEKLRSEGKKPFFFPVGGSVPTGCWGYVRAFDEILDQLRKLNIKRARFVVAVGSGGTHTGLVLGSRLLKRPEFHVTGFNVTSTPEEFRKDNALLFRETAETFHLSVEADEDDFELIGDYVGPGYAQPYPELMKTIKKVALTEGVLLDPVYTGKAFHGLLEEIRKGNITAEEPVIFIHTGGVFGLFPQREMFEL
mgnify:CR=1 FL=1